MINKLILSNSHKHQGVAPGKHYRLLHLNNKGILDEPLDLIVLIIGGIVIFSVLYLILMAGKEDAKVASTDLATKTSMMSTKLAEWKINLEEGKIIKPKTRLESDLKVIARTGYDPNNDPLQSQPNSPEEAKPGFKS